MDGTGDRPEPRRGGRGLQPRPAPGGLLRPDDPAASTEELTARLARLDALERRLRSAIAAVEEVQAASERRLAELEAQLAGTTARLEERTAALEATAAALAAATPPRLRVPPPATHEDTSDDVADDDPGEGVGEDVTGADAADPAAAREELIARLVELEGIGPARARRVADAFGDAETLATADPVTVAERAALPETAAAAIVAHVQG